MQNVIKNKTKKLFKNYYFTQIYLFIYFIFFRNKEKRIKNLFNHKKYKYKIC